MSCDSNSRTDFYKHLTSFADDTLFLRVIPQATVSSLIFIGNILKKADSLLTGCSPRTWRPCGAPSPDGERSPTCISEAGGSGRRKHTRAGGGEARREIPGTFRSRTLHPNLPDLAGPQASRSRVPSALTPSAKPLLPQTPKEAELVSSFNQRRWAERDKVGCALAQKEPRVPFPECCAVGP